MSTRRANFSKRRARRKTSFPLVAVVQKKSKPQYNFSAPFTHLGKKVSETSSKKTPPSKSVKRSRGTIDYKNVVLLRKLITAEGKILPRRINKLTAKQQRYTSKAIKSARIIGLLPFINKSRSFTV
uniref:ribosomal protein S18 n=1 Tax=Massjukichlorella minus TaxID=2650457 RepID=UPI00241116F6|nr:ribosomal protein S18 [Massjukichlorella minus]WDY12995.1 ribosomal protein S18 [Massjukichlorella minus]